LLHSLLPSSDQGPPSPVVPYSGVREGYASSFVFFLFLFCADRPSEMYLSFPLPLFFVCILAKESETLRQNVICPSKSPLPLVYRGDREPKETGAGLLVFFLPSPPPNNFFLFPSDARRCLLGYSFSSDNPVFSFRAGLVLILNGLD